MASISSRWFITVLAVLCSLTCISQPPIVINVGAGETFTSLTGSTGLFQYLKQSAWQTDIAVNITSDLLEDGKFALDGDSAFGHSLTIQPLSASVRVIQNNGDLSKEMIRIIRMSNVTIDGRFNGNGRYLRFINTHSAPRDCQAAIRVDSGSRYITIRNAIVEGNGEMWNSQPANILIGTTGSNREIDIRENLIHNATGTPGVAGLMSIGIMSSSSANKKIRIVNNEIFNFERYGIYFSKAADSCLIDGNHFYYNHPVSAKSVQIAIEVIGFYHVITNNYIGGSSPFAAGGPWIKSDGFTGNEASITGISVRNIFPAPIPPVYIRNNTIKNILISYTDEASLTAIKTLGSVVIENNTIGDENSANSLVNAATGFASYTVGIRAQTFDSSWINNNIIANIVATGESANTELIGITTGGQGVSTVKNNRIHALYSASTKSRPYFEQGLTGLYLWGSSWGHIVEDNLVYDLNGTGTAPNTLVAGIRALMDNAPGTFVLKRNRVYGVQKASPGGEVAGIEVRGQFRLENNQVAVTNGTSTEPVSVYGINDMGFVVGDTASYYYNSVYVGGSAASGNLKSYAYYKVIESTVTKFQNNILYNERTGGTGKHYAIGITNHTTSARWLPQTSDYNFFIAYDSAATMEYATNSVGPAPHSIMSWRGITRGDSSSLATLVTKVPAASLFANFANGDLSIDSTNSFCWYVNGKGKPVASISGDFFNAAGIRSTDISTGATDIGSHEFTTSAIPPVLDLTGRHQAGGIDSLSIGGRLVATLQWGNTGVLPALGDARFYSGRWPNDPTNNGAVSNPRSLNEWWDIPVTGGSGYTYSLTLYYDSALLGKITNVNTMLVNKRQAGVPGSWTAIRPSVINAAAKTITINNQTSFSEFTATDADASLEVLPVNLLSFNAELTVNDIILKWLTAGEENHDYFEIERSTDNRTYIPVTRVRGSNNNTVNNYQYADLNAALLPAAKIYYRLKSVSNTGAIEYSNTVIVWLSSDSKLVTAIVPNPFIQKFSIGLNMPRNGQASIRITDLQGRLVYQQYALVYKGFSTYVFDKTENLTTGMYLLSVEFEGDVYTTRIIKQ